MVDVPNLPLIKKPGTYVAYNLGAQRKGLSAAVERLLFVTHDDTGPVQPTKYTSSASVGSAFGVGSNAQKMFMAAVTANPYADIEICRFGGGAGSNAVVLGEYLASMGGDLVFYYGPMVDTGATETGDLLLSFRINGGATQTITIVRQDSNLARLLEGETATSDVLDALNAVLEVDHNVSLSQEFSSLVVPSGVYTCSLTRTDNAVESVEFVSSSAGLDDIDFAEELGIVGQTYSFASPSTITDVFNIIKPLGHTLIVLDETPLGDDRADWIDYLVDVGGVIEQRPAVLCFAQNDLDDAIAIAGAMPSHLITIPMLNGSTDDLCKIAAGYAAVIASEPDPARPLNGLVINGLAVPAQSSWLTRTQYELALTNGVTPLEPVNGQVEIVRAITTYAVDDLMLDLTKTRSLHYVMTDIRTALGGQAFRRRKNSVRTRAEIKSAVIERLKKLESAEIIENVQDNLPLLIVETNQYDGARVDVQIPAELIEGLHVLGAVIDVY